MDTYNDSYGSFKNAFWYWGTTEISFILGFSNGTIHSKFRPPEGATCVSDDDLLDLLHCDLASKNVPQEIIEKAKLRICALAVL